MWTGLAVIATCAQMFLSGCGRPAGAREPGNAERLQAALETGAAPTRAESLVALFATWSREDVQGLNATLSSWPGGDARWGRALPALQQVLPSMNDRLGKDPALVHLVSLVSGAAARQDPDAAAAWARKSLGIAGRQVAFAVIVEELALKSPERATRLTDEIEDSVIKLDAIYAIGNSLGAAKPETALAWVRTLPESNRAEATKAVIEGWAGVHPRDALAYLQRENDADGAAVVLACWAKIAPGDASLAAQAVADPAAREKAIEAVVTAFDGLAPADASATQWAQGLPAGMGRDAVNASLAEGLVTKDPHEAWRAARAIGDSRVRDESSRIVIVAVATDDSAIARKLIDEDRKLGGAEAAAFRSLIGPSGR